MPEGILARGADARSTNTDSQKVAPKSISDRGTQTTLEVERSGKQGTEGKKRNARSPLEPTTREEKRVRRNAIPVVRQLSTQLSEIENQPETETERETDDWKKVETREEKRRRRKEDGREAMSSQTKQMRRLPEAVAVKIKSLSYLDALRSIKSKIDPDKLTVTVSGIRQTRGGEILIEIKKGSGGAEELRSSLVDALGEEALVRTMDKMVALEVRDLDGTTEEEEVAAAIKSVVGEVDLGPIKVQSLRKDFGETQIAVVTMPSRAAEVVLKQGRVRIGWVVCRVREMVKILKCCRCLGFGHMARECKEPDHSKTCRNCGKDGHIAKNCKEKAFCIVCDRNGQAAQHKLGSKDCEAFRRELKKAKK